jgi:hypothetical protein
LLSYDAGLLNGAPTDIHPLCRLALRYKGAHVRIKLAATPHLGDRRRHDRPLAFIQEGVKRELRR